MVKLVPDSTHSRSCRVLRCANSAASYRPGSRVPASLIKRNLARVGLPTHNQGESRQLCRRVERRRLARWIAAMSSFKQSFQPVVVWMKCFGFPLDASKLWRFVVFGSLMTLATSALHCFSFFKGCERLKADNSTTANLLNIGIEHLNYTCILITVHFAFFAVCLNGDWIDLWEQMLEIEQHLNLKKSFYSRCRRIIFIGYFLLFLDSATFFYMSLYSSYWKVGSMRPLAIVLANVTRTAVLNIFHLFCLVTRIVAHLFRVLNERLRVLSSIERYFPSHSAGRILLVRLEKWRRNHARVCRLVESINRSFGLIILITVTNGFVSFITTSYEIVKSFQDNNSPPPVIFMCIFVKKLILLGIMVYEPCHMETEASRALASLREIHSSSHDLIVQLKINSVTTEVAKANPKISAMEFFDVNLRLFPTLIGTTLTYVAILCQASSKPER